MHADVDVFPDYRSKMGCMVYFNRRFGEILPLLWFVLEARLLYVSNILKSCNLVRIQR